MAIGTQLKVSRERRELHQYQVGSLAGYSVQMISAIERGERSGDAKVIANVARKLDDGDLLAEVAAEITGGVFVQPPLNGPNVDLHRSAVLEKVIEEARELIDAAEALRSIALRPNSAWTDTEIGQVRTTIMESMGCEGACQVFARVFSQAGQLSLTELYSNHAEKLKTRGYRK